MPPRKKTSAAPPALTDDDVAGLRERVKSGEKPRVVVRTASATMPAGTRGNVVRIGSPSDGEFIVVRLGRDEVPFAPSELAIATRGKNGAPAARAASEPAATKTTTKATTARPAGKTRATADPKPVTRSPAGQGVAGRGRKAASSRRTPPPLIVTLRFADGQWSVEASRGSRRLAKPSTLRPGAVKAFADLVDEPSVREALTDTVESCRAVVEERAAALREQLLAAEATLKDYDARRR